MAKDIIQKIIDNKSSIVAIRLNGILYDVDYISVDDAECFDMLAPNDTIIKSYLLENDIPVWYNFTVEDIKKASKVQLYKIEEL